MKKKTLKIIIPALIAIVVLVVALVVVTKKGTSTKEFEDNTIFTVEDGAYGKIVFNDLEEQGIISSGNLSYYYVSYLTKESMDFKAGSYLLSPNMSLTEIVETLCDSSKIYRPTSTVLIIEGDTLEEIAMKVSSVIDVTYDDLLAYWDDEEIVKTYFTDYSVLTDDIFTTGIRHYLEGYLFPNTYEIYNDASLDEITRKFLDQTQAIYDEYKDDFDNASTYYNWTNGRSQQLSIHEVFTLASICQWESGNSDDMPMIAGVFLNRLNDSNQTDAKLYSNVTACYAQGLYKTDCTAIDDSIEKAYDDSNENEYYNTYNINDLPVSPICNPGEAAIKAVLHPTESDYYYFVGYCGVTYYSTKAEGNEVLSQYKGC